MTSTNFRRTLVGAAVAAALGVTGDPAVAAPYKGIFDPIDFEGEYIVNVDPGCLTQGNGWFANDGICSATLTSAVASVVSTTPDPGFSGEMTFAPPVVTDTGFPELFGLYVYGGKIDSFDTTLIHQASPATPGGEANWWIQFVSGNCPISYGCYGGFGGFDSFEALQPAAIENSVKGVYLYRGTDPVDPVASAQYIGPAEPVPEPGTLALILGALGGGWLARRRRKEKEPAPD